MKILNKYFFILALLAVGLYSCEDETELDNFNNGEANFSNYVALGNSLTAGFADNALYLDAQQNSYPALLAEQFAVVGGGDFTQPLVEDNVGGLTLQGNVIANPKLVFNGMAPVVAEGSPSTEVGASIAGEGPFNNLGVPGAKSFHLLSDSYGALPGLLSNPPTANPYYVRFSQPNTSVLAAAVAQQPTFYTLWIGNNDVLGYATSGGEGDVITPSGEFEIYIGALLQGLSQTGAQGVIANIPDVSATPYFNVVPNEPIDLDEATATGVNMAYAQYNGGLDQLVMAGILSAEEAALRKISFEAGANPPVIIDNDLTDLTAFNPALINMRQLKEGELLTLPSSNVLGTLADPNNPQSVIGVGVPLGSEFSLTSSELDNVNQAIASYNQIISATAAQLGVPVADMNDYFSTISNSGLLWSGANYSVEFVTGGLFSLDGIHPSQKGYAAIANQFINTINNAYNAQVPLVDINNYPGVVLP